MRKLVLVMTMMALCVVSFAVGQTASEKIDTTALMRIKDEGMNRSQVMEIMSYLTDVYGPRLAWSSDYRDGATWVASKLKEWGLQNVEFENCEPVGKGWTLKKFSAQAIEPKAFPLIAYPKAWSPGLKGAVRGQAVHLQAKTEADLDQYKGKLKGAFVLVSDIVPARPHFAGEASRLADSALLKLSNASLFDLRGGRRPQNMFDSTAIQRFLQNAQFAARKAEFCQREGAVMLLDGARGDYGTIFVAQASVPSAPKSLQEMFGPSQAAYSANAPAILPQVSVASEHYNRMVRMIQKGQKVKLEMSLEIEFTKPDSGFNILAEIPGTDLKDEIVMVGGHFDSWHAGTGATDDGSGTGATLEAIRILKAAGLQPRRTIRVGLWHAEEEGLLGSAAYVARHFGERKSVDRLAMMMGIGGGGTLTTKTDHAKLSVYFNHDNGGGRLRGVYLQGNEATRPIFRSWLNAFGDPTAQTLSNSNTGGTDHLSFDAVGLPGFQFIQDPMDYDTRTHHSNMDVYERLQEDDMKQAATMMAFFLYNASTRDEKFPRKPLPAPPGGAPSGTR